MSTFLAFMEDGRTGVVDTGLLSVRVELAAALVDALFCHDGLAE